MMIMMMMVMTMLPTTTSRMLMAAMSVMRMRMMIFCGNYADGGIGGITNPTITMQRYGRCIAPLDAVRAQNHGN